VDKVIREGAVRVGVDLAKRVIQVHAVDAVGRVLSARTLVRDRFIEWCARLPAGCVVAMEASSSAHHWARKLIALGLDARIISAQLVEPYRSQGASGKNDANDAAAICEAASRPTMRFIPVKSIEQQSMLCVHRLREGLKEDRTACINRIRGLLAEFGIVLPQKAQVVRREAARHMDSLPGLGKIVIEDLLAEIRHLDERTKAYDAHVRSMARDCTAAQQLMQIIGIGEVTATAIVAMVGTRASCQPMPVLMIVAPALSTAFARATTSSHALPPSTRSSIDRRYTTMKSGPQASRTRRTISTAKRMRCAASPPQASVRLLVRATVNWLIR